MGEGGPGRRAERARRTSWLIETSLDGWLKRTAPSSPVSRSFCRGGHRPRRCAAAVPADASQPARRHGLGDPARHRRDASPRLPDRRASNLGEARRLFDSVRRPLAARVGQRGISERKHEGDLTTPSGAFRIHPLMFGVGPNPGLATATGGSSAATGGSRTGLPFLQPLSATCPADPSRRSGSPARTCPDHPPRTGIWQSSTTTRIRSSPGGARDLPSRQPRERDPRLRRLAAPPAPLDPALVRPRGPPVDRDRDAHDDPQALVWKTKRPARGGRGPLLSFDFATRKGEARAAVDVWCVRRDLPWFDKTTAS